MPAPRNDDTRTSRTPRYSLTKRVRVRLDQWHEFAALYTANVSEGGFFVEMAPPSPPGTRMSIEISDGQGHTMLLPGEVVHANPPRNRPDSTGVGIRFLELSEAEREVVAALIEDARRRGG